MSPPLSPNPRRPQRHIGLFISPELELGREIMGGFSTYALQHPEWILYPIPSGWESVPKSTSLGFDAVIAFMAREDSTHVFHNWLPRVINVSSRYDSPEFARVVTDDVAVGRLAAQHFLDRGFQSFAIVAMKGVRFCELRIEGFISKLQAAGVDAGQIAVHRMGLRNPSKDHSLGIEGFLKGLPNPVGVFADCDWTAFKIRRICMINDLQVPDQVAILGVDNDPYICQLGNASLSSIELDGAAIGRAAGEWVHKGLSTEKWEKRLLLVPPVGVVERLSTENAAVEDPLIRKALQFIRTHAVLGAGVEELCQHLAITRKTLDRRFQAHTGKTPHEMVLQRRVEYARRLLRESDEKLEAVAFGSGFNDVRTLGRAFAKFEGTTLAAYRKQFS